jgi:hypothetical protein
VHFPAIGATITFSSGAMKTNTPPNTGLAVHFNKLEIGIGYLDTGSRCPNIDRYYFKFPGIARVSMITIRHPF